MPIQCKICQREFKSLITNSHLKSHGITTDQYKEKYGKDSLSSPEYKARRSEKYSGENNPMYGKKHDSKTIEKISSNRKGKVGRTGNYSEEGLKSIKEGIKNREEKYKNGELTRIPIKHNSNTKKKISSSMEEYSSKNKDKLTERGKKAYKTASARGNWKPPMQRLKESNPSKYQEKCIKSRQSIKKANEKRSTDLRQNIQKKIDSAQLNVINEFKSKVSNLWTFELLCSNCNTKFTFTRQYFTNSKFNVEICPTCYPREKNISSGEEEVYEYLNSISSNIIRRNDRTLLDNGREVDIYIPELSLAIEYNGLYWHSESILLSTGREKLSDFLKYKELKNKGITLISIYEDEWLSSKSIVKSMLKNRLGVLNNKVFARKCLVKEITTKQAKEFLNANHLQGYNKSNIKLGLFFNDELVTVMTFSKGNLSRRTDSWEIDRFASKKNHIVVGGANKLWKYFLREYDPSEVLTYADNRWSSGELYKKLGFSMIATTNPGYWYFLPNEIKRIHRFTLRKNDNDDPKLTEYENRKLQGYLRIWDCGNSKWQWKKKSPKF